MQVLYSVQCTYLFVHRCCTHLLSTGAVHIFCTQVLYVSFVHRCCTHIFYTQVLHTYILYTGPVHIYYTHYTGAVHIFCTQVLYTYLLYTGAEHIFCTQVLYTGAVHISCTQVLYTVSTEVILACPMKFSAYPLDKQTCKFLVSRYTKNIQKL